VQTGTLGLTYDAEGNGAAGTWSAYVSTSATYDATATLHDVTGTVSIEDLAPDAVRYIFIVANVGTDATDDASDAFAVTATALTAGTDTVVVASDSFSPTTVETVFADPGTDGLESST